MPPKAKNELSYVLRGKKHAFQPLEISRLFKNVEQARVERIASALANYISINLPAAIERRDGLADYRTNPYVLLTTASVMKLSNPKRFADFLFNNKLYMGLETSFGKSIEATLMGQYPIDGTGFSSWEDPIEKKAEFQKLTGLSRQARSLERNNSVWREIDKSCVKANKRYLLTIKSGPACINDTQVEGMKAAIAKHYKEWLKQSSQTYPLVDELDIVVGITYGTDSTTNNKENQILVKLLGLGFEEENRELKPGVLIDSSTRRVRVYRVVGQEFWSFVGNPALPNFAPFVFLEILISLTKALSLGMNSAKLEERINRKIMMLSSALAQLTLPEESLPTWIHGSFDEDSLFWLATALTAFFDKGV
jgi:hypothetical protein